jgi:hypothetical protein
MPIGFACLLPVVKQQFVIEWQLFQSLKQFVIEWQLFQSLKQFVIE